VAALDAKKRGRALDVYENEPFIHRAERHVVLGAARRGSWKRERNAVNGGDQRVAVQGRYAEHDQSPALEI